MCFGLASSTIEKIRGVFAHHPSVGQVLIYGSRAMGTSRPGSDVDLACMGQDFSWKELIQIERELDDLMLPYSFDVSVCAEIENEDLIDHIRRVGKVFYDAGSKHGGPLMKGCK